MAQVEIVHHMVGKWNKGELVDSSAFSSPNGLRRLLDLGAVRMSVGDIRAAFPAGVFTAEQRKFIEENNEVADRLALLEAENEKLRQQLAVKEGKPAPAAKLPVVEEESPAPIHPQRAATEQHTTREEPHKGKHGGR